MFFKFLCCKMLVSPRLASFLLVVKFFFKDSALLFPLYIRCCCKSNALTDFIFVFFNKTAKSRFFIFQLASLEFIVFKCLVASAPLGCVRITIFFMSLAGLTIGEAGANLFVSIGPRLPSSTGLPLREAGTSSFCPRLPLFRSEAGAGAVWVAGLGSQTNNSLVRERLPKNGCAVVLLYDNKGSLFKTG